MFSQNVIKTNKKKNENFKRGINLSPPAQLSVNDTTHFLSTSYMYKIKYKFVYFSAVYILSNVWPDFIQDFY